MTGARPHTLALVFVATLLLSAAPAMAEDAPGAVALVTVPGSQAGLEWADRVAARLAQKLGGRVTATPAQVRDAIEKRAGARALRQAGKAATEANQALESFDNLERAARLLREAADSHLELLPLLQTIDEPVRLLVGLATVQLALGQQGSVDHALEVAARLDPQLDLDPQEVSPRLARAAREAREGAGARALLTPEAARLLASDVGATTLLVIQPNPDHRNTLIEEYGATSGDRVRSWHVTGQDLSSVVEAIGTAPPAGASGGTDQQVVLTMGTDPSVEGREDFETAFNDSTGGDAVRRPFYRTWWFWTIVGAIVVAGGTVGLVLGLQNQDAQGDLSLEVHEHW